MSWSERTYPRIEDHLGPRDRRFFGTGYKRVRHQLADAIVDADARRITAGASLDYPEDWSSKSASVSLRPHVSTIDAVVLSVALAETYLSYAFGFDAASRRSLWLRRMVIKAGTTAQENLRNVGVHADLVGTAERSGFAVSTFDGAVGNLRTRCEVAHPVVRDHLLSAAVALPEDLLGDAERRYFGTGYQRRVHELSNVRVAPRDSVATADADVLDPDPCVQGLAGQYQPAFSIIDGIIVLAQLSQSFLYQLDDIDRANSHTLWMRRLEATSHIPPSPLTDRVPARTSMTRSAILNFDGSAWRTSEWDSHLHGIRFSYRLGHRLPISSLVAAA
ncbi:AvrD family protein [Amycolatopsis sp. CA-230715]|uniref:AvrD family protein n=1 Tax=Amycolatopsis sp. CA-230715 TaxID=2745196 RepID=UPI001C01465B|nr:AvrD family protein [Amycolatopsis sp. CA-230715]QWF85861.1 hypothetical protein HUW46_09341 [Amycolatopsis sp. CA-230715]